MGPRTVIAGDGASVWCTLADKGRQCGRKHQHFGLHEGQIGQSSDHFSRLFTQVLFLPGFPVQTGNDQRAAAMIIHENSAKTVKSSSFRLTKCLLLRHWNEDTVNWSDLVAVLVFSMVDMSRAKASTMRLLELLRSSFAVVSSYSSGSTPVRDRKRAGFYCEIQIKFGRSC